MPSTTFTSVAIAIAFVATQASAYQDCEGGFLPRIWDVESETCVLDEQELCVGFGNNRWINGECEQNNEPDCDKRGDDWSYDEASNTCNYWDD